MTQDHKALIAGAKLAERTVPLYMRADLVARLQELERALAEAEAKRKAGAGSLAGGSASRGIAEEIELVRLEMVDHTLVFRLRALPRRVFSALQLQHPPREGHAYDQAISVNTDTFTEALTRASIVAPVLDEEDWEALDANLSDGQWSTLTQAAWAVNARDVEVPFSRAASRVLQTSDGE